MEAELEVPARTFQCTIVECHRFDDGPVALDGSFGCARRECRGNQILEGRVPEVPPAWRRWVRPAIGVAIAVLAPAAIFWRKAPAPVRKDFSTPAQIDIRQQGPKPTPGLTTPVPPLPIVDASLRLEVDSLVSCSQNLLRLCRARTVALDTAEAKWVNGQRVSTSGREAGEALDRVKTTYQQERIFNEIAQLRQKDIMSEASRYLEIVAHLMTLEKASVKATTARLQKDSLTAPPRNALAVELVCRHVEDCTATGTLTLERVLTDFQQYSLR